MIRLALRNVRGWRAALIKSRASRLQTLRAAESIHVRDDELKPMVGDVAPSALPVKTR
jgi:hypothetical protein